MKSSIARESRHGGGANSTNKLMEEQGFRINNNKNKNKSMRKKASRMDA